VTENEISKHIVERAIEAHRTPGGPGLLESVYEDALAWELRHRGLHVDRRLKVPIVYKGNNPGDALRLDLLVEGRVIIEVKSVTAYRSSERKPPAKRDYPLECVCKPV